jgi:signal transduction histidine kinase
MASAQAPAARPQSRGRATTAAPLRRPLERAVVGGVCAGLSEKLGFEVRVLRVMMVMAATAGGLGVAAYALAWALIPIAAEREGGGRRRGAWREAAVIVVAVVALFTGARLAGSRIGDNLWPLVVGVCGMALLWRPVVDSGPGANRRMTLREYLRPGQIGAPRLIVGGLLVAFASAVLLHAVGVQHSLIKAVWAVAIIATVLGLVVGPWMLRLVGSLSFERSARIREQERAELAAHLHDSVLQTLALIQKRASDPREVAGLARRQERELRSWLLGRPAHAQQDSVAGALERAAAEVEELHRVPIEVVTVGDGPLHGLEALVQAAREAMTNAAKFAGADHVDLYAEVQGQRTEVYVRDRGVGFELDAIPSDRRGVRESIVGRMDRHGGSASVRSRPGEGTEVELVMERGASV